MPSSFFRSLAVLEVLGQQEPAAVSELARAAKLDKGAVSRLLRACLDEGWVIRIDGKYALGPRAAILGNGGVQAEVVHAAESLVHAIAGTTGLWSHAYQIAGTQGFTIASAAGRGYGVAGHAIGRAFPLWALGGGKALAAQLDDDLLEGLVPPDPLPRYTERTIETRAEILAQIREIRAGAPAREFGVFDPHLACIALPWPHRLDQPLALACLGRPDELRRTEDVALRALRAATQVGATADDVIRAAAQA
jgi:DNA-binding IclR family transcriptional regulator